MNIVVIGTANVGGTLGVRWAQAGHRVTFGIRQMNERVQQRLAESGNKAAAKPIEQALQTAEIVTLAIPGKAVDSFLADYGTELNHKIVIDATNRIGTGRFHDLEALHAVAPEARYVRAFNSIGWEMFAEPIVNGEQAALFYCGVASAQKTADLLISDIGLQPVYLGENDQIAVVDNLARVWFALAFGQGKGRRVALRLLEE